MTEIFKRYKYVYDSRKHLLEMLEDRGFEVEHLKNYTSEDIKEIMVNHISGKFTTLPDIGPLDIFLEKNVDKTNAEKIYVKYRLDSKFKGTTSLTTQILEIYEKYFSWEISKS